MCINLQLTVSPLVRPQGAALCTVLMLLLGACTSHGGSPAKAGPDTVYQATGIAESAFEGDAEVKRLIIEQALGAIVESGSAAVDGKLRYAFVTSHSAGYVRNYMRSEVKELPTGGFRVTGSGQVSLKALGDALRERAREIGNPRMMILMNEEMFGRKSSAGTTKTEYELQSRLKEAGFVFIDRQQFQSVIARERGLQVAAYDNLRAESAALQAAAELNAEILVIGTASFVNGGEVRKGTGVYSIQADVRFKVLNVGTAGIMATSAESAISSDVNPDLGATAAAKKVTAKIAAAIKAQVGQEWQSGSTTRLTFRGIEMGDFLTSGIGEIVGKVRGVTGVHDRGNAGGGPTLEVICYCSSYALVRGLMARRWEFNQRIAVGDISGNRAVIKVSRR